MFSCYKFRLYPSLSVQKKLIAHREECRWLYNRLLEEIKRTYKKGRKINQLETQALIVKLKHKERPELKQVYSKVLQMVNHQIWSSIRSLQQRRMKGFKVGWLRFKGKNQFKILYYNQYGFKIDDKKRQLILSKIGEIPIKLHRSIDGKIKGIILKQYASGKWFGILQVELPKQDPSPSKNSTVGIDVGLKHFLTDSHGRQVENPHFYFRTLARIKRLSRKLSRKRDDSRNRERTRCKLAKVYEKLINQRDDFLHKLSRFYIDNYDVIVIEDLRIGNLVQNRRLGQRILDASWCKFFRFLSYKAERAGRTIIKINPRGTSKEQHFGKGLDRDYNAALNIHKRGVGHSPLPVERGPLHRITASAVVAGQVSAMKQEAYALQAG